MNQLLKVSLGQLPNIIVSDPSFKDSSWNQHVINPLPDGIYEMDAYAKSVDMGRDSYVQFDFLVRHLIPEMERMPLAFRKLNRAAFSCKARMRPVRVVGCFSCCCASHKLAMLLCWPAGFSVSAFVQL